MSEWPAMLADSHPQNVMDREDLLGPSHSPRVSHAVYQSINDPGRVVDCSNIATAGSSLVSDWHLPP